MDPFDLDKFIEYMVVTDQVDDTFGLKEKTDTDDKEDTKEEPFLKKIGTWRDK